MATPKRVEFQRLARKGKRRLHFPNLGKAWAFLHRHPEVLVAEGRRR